MNINQILPLISNICIYYYIAYHNKILSKSITIPNNVYENIMHKVYHEYTNAVNEEDVYDIMIMQFPDEKLYTLKEDDIDFVEITHVIDEYIDRHVYCYDTTVPINVISLSNHPLERYIHFTHQWIKSNIDLYRY